MTTVRWEFLRNTLDLPFASGVDGARWEPFQVALLNTDATFAIETKSRQIAWSWTVAAEAVAEAVLSGQSSAFVSINLLEATEKMRYARTILEALQQPDLPKLIRDNALGMEFANGARIMSLPARPPRGKARLNIYLDEFAHVQYDRDIYTAALPIISKGGRLRIGSSPLGAGGVFWEVFTEKLRPYPGYVRRSTPWWCVFAFCRDVLGATVAAPTLSTADRVARFGTERIQVIYANMPEDDFRQEYECDFVDESVAWVTWAEIQAVQDKDLLTGKAECAGKAIGAAFGVIDELAESVRQGKIERVLAGGVDVGRQHDTTELYLVGQTTTGHYPLRGMVTLSAVEYDDQYSVLAYALKTLPVAKLLIDQTGLGNNLAENLAKAFPAKAEGVTFTGPNKALWATDAKMLIQQRKTPLPADRDLAYQIHSIKRATTSGKQMSFDVGASEKHHADKWWAWVLALAAASEGGQGFLAYLKTKQERER